jgi:hypothetical protein
MGADGVVSTAEIERAGSKEPAKEVVQGSRIND